MYCTSNNQLQRQFIARPAVFYFAIFLTYATGSNWNKLAGGLLATCTVAAGIFAAVILPTQISHDMKVNILGGLAVACNVVM